MPFYQKFALSFIVILLNVILLSIVPVFGQQLRQTPQSRGFVPTSGTTSQDSPMVSPSSSLSPSSSAAEEEAFFSSETFPQEKTSPADPLLGQRIANVSRPSGGLPNHDGQIFREYDITPFTLRPGAMTKPEMIVVNWILRQTGPEFWHSQPFGIMSATNEKLYVYHTPETQVFVANIVDRFVNPESSQEIYSLRMISVGGPTWRTSHVNQYLQPIPVKTVGVQGWLLAKEDYARLTATLSQRSDFRDHISSSVLLNNGQPLVIPYRSPRNYIRDAKTRPDMPGGYVTDPTAIEEGYYLEATPLMGLDRTTADVMLKFEFLQVEKMIPMIMDVPTAAAPGQKITIETPQTAMFKLDEQIRWPKDKVLMVDLGMIPMPTTSQAVVKENLINKLTAQSSSKRVNVLLFVESRGPAVTLPTQTPAQ